jgi:hypothetical protein
MYTAKGFYIIATEAQCWLDRLSDAWGWYADKGVDEEHLAAVAEAATALECLLDKAPRRIPYHLQLLTEEEMEQVDAKRRKEWKARERAAKRNGKHREAA